MIIYNKHEQSQQNSIRYNPAFVKDSFQFVQKNFTEGEQLVIGALMTYMDYKEIYPSYPTLAQKAGVSQRTAWSAIDKLRDLGLISTKQRMNQSLLYYFSSEFYLTSVRSQLRPLMSTFFMSTSLLFVSSSSDLTENCELRRNTEYLNSKSSSLLSLKKSLSSLLTNSNQQLSTNCRQLGDSSISIKEQKMRMLLKEAQRHVNLTEADIELLDTLSDAAIAKALKKLKTNTAIANKAAYFMKIAQYEAGSIQQDKSHLASTSDNDYLVKPYVNKQLSLESGYKPRQDTDKNPLKREVSKFSDIKQSQFTKPSQETKLHYKTIRYALVDPVLFANDFIRALSQMTECEQESWKKMWGNSLPDVPHKLPYVEKNMMVFKRDENNQIIFSD